MPLPIAKLSPEDVQRWIDAWERARDRDKGHREEGRHRWDLYEGEPEAWRKEAGDLDMGEASRQDIIHNALAAAIRSDVDQNTPKNARVVARPMCENFMRNGQKVDNAYNAMVVGSAGTFCARQVGLRGVQRRAYLDAKLTNVAYALITGCGGGDLSTVSGFVSGGEEDEGGLTTAYKRYNSAIPNHPQMQDHVPGLGWLSFEKCAMDPEAVDDEEATWYAHEVTRPTRELQEEMVPKLDEDGAKIAGEDGLPVMVKKYKNLDKIRPNEGWERSDGEKDRGEPMPDEMPPEDYTRFIEFHRREPLPWTERKKYRSAFRWIILAIATHPDGSGEGVEIRHEEYRVDYGMCAMRRLKLHQVNGRQIGRPVVSDYSHSIALANRALMMWYRWQMKFKPVRFYDPESVDKEELEFAESEADVLDWVPMRRAGEGRTLQDSLAIAPQIEPPQTLMLMIERLFSVATSVGGQGPNQRGQVEGIRTAEEVKTVQNASAKIVAEEREKLIEWTESIIVCLIRGLRAELPDNDEGWSIPGVDGNLRFWPEDLDGDFVVSLDYMSQARDEEPIKVKQVGESIKMLAGFPPPLLEALHPLLGLYFRWQGEDMAAAYEEFRAGMQQEDPHEPDTEHVMMLNGHRVKIDGKEDGQANMQKHLAMLQQVVADREGNEAWYNSIGDDGEGGDVMPVLILAHHIVEHQQILSDQGRRMPGQLGVAGPGGGGGGNERGSAMNSGRSGQGVPSNQGLEASAGRPGVSEFAGAGA